MYLKRLETVGFKSFADRVELQFVPGITAIVGPNGSGKSNITDAIRWVLGEQSARSLRGMKMEDIIFQGSDTRNPLNVAEVTLVFDNASQKLPLDYEEVSITRRVYRSGESEFFINNNPCRLKDIIDLFIGQGLTRDSLSIIGQGKIEEILSSKAEDRRIIFEEAAGVLKYKQRKTAAEFKLAETEENLNRVEDIIFELETQLKPVKKQKEIALKYKKYRKELKSYEISLLITEIEHLHKKWTDLLRKLEEQTNKSISWQTNNQKRASMIEKEKSNLEKIDGQIERLQNDLVHLTEKLEQHDAEKSVMFERYKHLEKNKNNLQRSFEQLQEKKKQILQLKKENNSILQKIEKELHQNEKALDECRKTLHLNKDESETELQKLEDKNIQYQNEKAVIKNNIMSMENEIKQTSERFSEHKEQLDLFVLDKDQLEEKINLYKNKLEEANEKQENYIQQNEQIAKLINDNLKEMNRFDHLFNEALRKLSSIKSKEQLLSEMEREMQGYFAGPKNIIKAMEKRKLKGIHGSVLQLIDIPHEYTEALQSVLGNTIQYIVVENEKYARSSVEWLKKYNNGRATFLPLDTIQKRFISKETIEKIKDHKGFINVASHLIKTKEKYKRVVESLAGNVIVSKDLKSANEIAKKLHWRYRVVTIDGDIVHPGGAISGGSKRKQKSVLFTREKELKQLQTTRKKVEDDIKRINKNKEKLKIKLDKHEKEKLKVDITLKTIAKDIELLKGKLLDKQHSYNALVERVNLYNKDHKQNTLQQKEKKESLQHNKKLLQEIERKLKLLYEKRKEIQKQKALSSAEKKEKEKELHRLEKKNIQIVERKNHYIREKSRLETELKSIQEEIKENKKELVELENIKQLQQQRTEMDDLVVKISTERESVKQQIQKLRKNRLEKQTNIVDNERELKASERELNRFTKEIQQDEIEANRLDVALENQLSFLQEEYKMTYDRAKKLYDKAENIEEIKEIVQNIKNKIANLQPVNLGAIEEYKRLSERFTFLSTQKQDLIEAKETLFEAIAEMDTKMKKQFSETFSQIQKQFSIVFKKLFGGGKAKLVLTDEDNLLETGIEIIAQPPGKKLRNLSLLSGGERALTAISLLFAMLHVRPVSFSVLDEVEAALDEANVTRFSKYLHEFSKDTQFIVITHRKGTMEEADVLYGVTMEESGVSRLVSVRLSDVEEVVHT